MKNGTKNSLTNPSVENEYFFWLCTGVDRRNGRDGFRELAALLHSIEFECLIPNDDNRAADGCELRKLFSETTGNPYPELGRCSVLEMLVALACKMDDVLTADPNNYNPERWFWEMIENLNLHVYEDEQNKRKVFNLINRNYEENGKGGLFPLRKPPHDQKQVELWYQFMAYAAEQYPNL